MSAWSCGLELDGEVQVVVRSGIGEEKIVLLHLTSYKANTFKETDLNFGQRISFASQSVLARMSTLFFTKSESFVINQVIGVQYNKTVFGS